MGNYIEEFLESYIGDNTYNYAVMINGDWGSGKTFFVKNYINNHNDKEKFLYVSLYGIKNLDEISKDIYAQILRKNSLFAKTIGKLKGEKVSVLGNVGGRIAIDLCKSKGIDVDGITNIYKNLVDLNKYIFVFDDLERNSIGMNEILGYINNLVEHSEIKAVIIANESKIDHMLYKEIKEKLIANTIIYEPNINDIFKIIINGLQENEDIKNSLIKNIDILIKIPNKNIRTYQFFLSKYIRAYKSISKIYSENIEENLLKKLIEEMYASAVSYKSGQDEDDSPRNLAFISKYIYWDSWDINEVKKISDIYIEKIKKDKCQSKLNQLTSWYVLEDEEIINLLTEVKEEIKENKYSAADFAKIIRLGLIITDKGFEKKYLEDIINEMKKKNYKSQDLESVVCLNDGYFSNDQEKNKEMSLKFRETINEISKSFDRNLNIKDVNTISEILKKDNWINELGLWIRNENMKNRKNFGLCNITDLINKVKVLNNNDIYILRSIFDECIFSKKDNKFLITLKKEIDKLVCEEKKNIKKTVLKWFSEDIDRVIGDLR